jgi:hypothetical protein
MGWFLISESDTAGKVFRRWKIADKRSSQRAKLADSGGAAGAPGVVAEVAGSETVRSADLPAVSKVSKSPTALARFGEGVAVLPGGRPSEGTTISAHRSVVAAKPEQSTGELEQATRSRYGLSAPERE